MYMISNMMSADTSFLQRFFAALMSLKTSSLSGDAEPISKLSKPDKL